MRRLAPLTLVLLLLVLAGPAAAVEIHSHRGGPIAAGEAFTPEDAQPAFEFGHSIGTDVVELDAKLSSDGVPVVIHDATLDRTTDCSGQVGQKSLAELAGCHVDTIGTDTKLKPVAGARVPVPKLADVLAWAKANGVKLNLEIKNQPTDPDYDPSPGFATTVIQAVTASGIPRDHVLVQSFWPPNLDVAKAAGYRTSYLSLEPTNEQAIEFAASRGYDVLSPAWPLSDDPADYVRRAHARGLPVVPYTFNIAEEVEAAVKAGVDAVITNDVIVAQRVIYGVDCPAGRLRESKLRAALLRARRVRDRARGAARVRAQASVRRVNGKRQAAKRTRLKVCTPGT